MEKKLQTEAWQNGPVPGVTPLLMPAAHVIMQAGEEICFYLKDFSDLKLWERPAGLASVGFHLQHMTGVLDRLFSYAKGELLTAGQFAYLKREGVPEDGLTTLQLVRQFQLQVEKALEQLKNTSEEDFLQARGIGRKLLPTNVIGLLFHAAEHIQRHLGQLLVTARIVQEA